MMVGKYKRPVTLFLLGLNKEVQRVWGIVTGYLSKNRLLKSFLKSLSVDLAKSDNSEKIDELEEAFEIGGYLS